MIVSVPSSARGEEPVTGASSMRTPRSAQRAADAPRVRRGDRGHVHAQQTLVAPTRSPRPRRAARESTCSPSTTMLTTMSLAAATSAGVAAARAPCSAAQRSALPGVCVHTVSGKPARATLAAIREPMMPRPRKPMRSAPCSSRHPRILLHRGFDAQPLAGAQRARRACPAIGLCRRAGRVPCAPVAAAVAPRGRVAAALGDQREGHLAAAPRARARRRPRRGERPRRPSRGAARTRARAAGIRARAPRSACSACCSSPRAPPLGPSASAQAPWPPPSVS